MGLRKDYTPDSFVPNPFFDPRRQRVSDATLTLYRTGDRVRWREGGVLEFLGRVDAQVKVRGYRIEPAEIERALCPHPSVAEAVVGVVGDHAETRRLVAWLVAEKAAAPSRADGPALRRHLLTRLPVHLVPTAFTWLPALPLSANGKVDVGALPEPEFGVAGEATPAADDLERVLMNAWVELLPSSSRIGRDTNFFDAGGDSIIALQIVSRAARQGVRVSPAQLFQYHTVAELAAVVEWEGDPGAPVAAARGEVALTPIQRWFFAQSPPVPGHYNQAVSLRLPGHIEPARLQKALERVLLTHDTLRLRFARDPERGWRQWYADETAAPTVVRHELSGLSSAARREAVERETAALRASLDLAAGPVVGAALFACGAEGLLLTVIAHHLVVDGVSFRVLLDEMQHAYRFPESPVIAGPRVLYGAWSDALTEAVPTARAELDYWRRVVETAKAEVPRDAHVTPEIGRTFSVRRSLDPTRAGQLSRQVTRASGHPARRVLLAALARTLADWCGGAAPTIDIETHGRDGSALGMRLDVSRTMGWFTAIHPFNPPAPSDEDMVGDRKSVV